MRKLLKLMLLLTFVLCFFIAKSQETTAEISGTISDATGGLSDVIVTAVHIPTGTKYVTTTRNDGRFNLPNLKIGGPYTLTTSFVGFKSETTTDII